MLIVRYLMHIDSRDSSAVIAALDSMNSGLETKVFEVLYSKWIRQGLNDQNGKRF